MEASKLLRCSDPGEAVGLSEDHPGEPGEPEGLKGDDHLSAPNSGL